MTTKFSGSVKAGSLRKRSKQGQQQRRAATVLNQMNIRPLFYYFSWVQLEFPNLVYKRREWAGEMALQFRTFSALTEERAGSQHPQSIQGFLEPSKVIRMRRHKLKLRESMWTGGGVKRHEPLAFIQKGKQLSLAYCLFSKQMDRLVTQFSWQSCNLYTNAPADQNPC